MCRVQSHSEVILKAVPSHPQTLVSRVTGFLPGGFRRPSNSWCFIYPLVSKIDLNIHGIHCMPNHVLCPVEANNNNSKIIPCS